MLTLWEGEKEIPGRNAILRADPQPDGSWVCKRMTTDTTGTNGLLISPDWRTLYMIQTNPERRELRAYDIRADGSLGRYIVLHQFGEDYRGPQRGIDDMRTLYVTTGGGHLLRARNTGRRGWIIWPPVR